MFNVFIKFLIMKILILATESLNSNFLINSLSKEYKLDILFENKVSKKAFWTNRIKRLGVNKVIGQFLFLFCSLFIQILNKKKIQNLLGKENYHINKNENVSINYIDSVNSETTIKNLKSLNPDLVILNGTRIISKKVLSSINCLFINTHCGITPKYRGVHGGYWAIYNKDLENYGVTIHKVDIGVDTGDILYQEKVKYDSKDNYFTYPIKQYLVAIPLIIKVIEKIYNGEQLTPYRRTDLQSQSRLWYHPTIFQYLYGLLVNQVK